MKTAAKLVLLVFVLLLGAAAVKVAVLAQDQAKVQKDAKRHETNNRSFFAGAKPVAAAGSQQQGLTATGGTKGLDGQMIGSAQPTSADRAIVTIMENYTIPEADLKKFQDEGKLIPVK